VAAYQLAVSTAFADVDNALSRRQNVIEELRSKRSLVMSLEDYSRLANAQYQGGYTGYFTVLQPSKSLLPAADFASRSEVSRFELGCSDLSGFGRWLDRPGFD